MAGIAGRGSRYFACVIFVAAMVGMDEQRRLYRLAIERRYRFFSYGDAMFVD